MATAAGVLMAGAVLAWSGPAAGDEKARIAVILERADDRIGSLLRYEIESLGLTAVAVSAASDGRIGPQWLETAARNAGAAAAIHVVAAGSAMEVWIADRVTGKVVLREIVQDDGTRVHDRVVVVRAIELLRASLMETAAPHPSRGEAAAAAASLGPLAASRTAARFTIGAGPGLVWSRGGVAPMPAGLIGARLRLGARSALELWAVLPAAARVASVEGSALVMPRMGGLGWARVWAPDAARVQLALGVGAAALWLHIEGRAAPPFAGSTDNHVALALLARGSLSFALLPRLHVAVELGAGASLPRSVIRFAERQIAAWGRPMVASGLRLELAWG